MATGPKSALTWIKPNPVVTVTAVCIPFGLVGMIR